MSYLFDEEEKKKKKAGSFLFDEDEEFITPAGEYAGELENRISNYETRLRAAGVEPPPPPKETNFLLKALDILDRPRNALVNAIQDVSTGENSFWQGLGEGFTGKEHASVSDLLPSGIENKFARTALGFTGDVALDPLTYLTFGAGGVAKGAAGQGARTLVKFAGKPVADITPAVQGIKTAVEKTGLPELAGPVFSNRYIRRSVTAPEEMPDIARARDVIMGTPQRIKGEQQIALDELRSRWQGVSPQAAQTASRIIEEPTLFKNKPELVPKAATYTPEEVRAADIARQITKETEAKDIAAGVEFGRLPNYIRHLYKDPPEKVMAALNRWQKQRVKLSPKGRFQKERLIPTIEEAKKLGLTPVEDARILTAVREMEGIRSRAMNQMYEQLKKMGDNVIRPADKAPPGWATVPVKNLSGYAVHPEVARFLQRFDDAMSTDEGVRNLVTLLNKVQNIWKGMVTAPNPSFHIRNAMGNVFNSFIGGVTNPWVYKIAADIQRGKPVTVNAGGRKYTGQQLQNMFRRFGLEGFGFFRGEAPRRMIEEAEEAFTRSSFGKELAKGKLVTAGRRVGDRIETNAKLAHFIDKLMKGQTPRDAAESVKKYLFDYSDLTPAERRIRNFVPFYTWARKNIPLQLENLIKQPGKYTAIKKLIDNAAKSNEIDEEYQPDWIKQELGIPVNIGSDEYPEYIMLDLPLTNLNMFEGGRDTLRNFLGMLTPLGKVPMELAMNKQMFTDQPIEKYPGAQAYFGNIKMPAKLAYALNQLGAVPRTAADIAGAFGQQSPPNSPVPPKPPQLPVLRTFVRSVDPERQKLFKAMDREEQLANLRRYLEEVKGIDVPTIREIEKALKETTNNNKKMDSYLF